MIAQYTTIVGGYRSVYLYSTISLYEEKTIPKFVNLVLPILLMDYCLSVFVSLWHRQLLLMTWRVHSVANNIACFNLTDNGYKWASMCHPEEQLTLTVQRVSPQQTIVTNISA